MILMKSLYRFKVHKNTLFLQYLPHLLCRNHLMPPADTFLIKIQGVLSTGGYN
jgi:hypothetical protein